MRHAIAGSNPQTLGCAGDDFKYAADPAARRNRTL
jgi:hypothetical protein